MAWRDLFALVFAWWSAPVSPPPPPADHAHRDLFSLNMGWWSAPSTIVQPPVRARCDVLINAAAKARIKVGRRGR